LKVETALGTMVAQVNDGEDFTGVMSLDLGNPILDLKKASFTLPDARTNQLTRAVNALDKVTSSHLLLTAAKQLRQISWPPVVDCYRLLERALQLGATPSEVESEKTALATKETILSRATSLRASKSDPPEVLRSKADALVELTCYAEALDAMFLLWKSGGDLLPADYINVVSVSSAANRPKLAAGMFKDALERFDDEAHVIVRLGQSAARSGMTTPLRAYLNEVPHSTAKQQAIAQLLAVLCIGHWTKGEKSEAIAVYNDLLE
jgi:hypothetical protein